MTVAEQRKTKLKGYKALVVDLDVDFLTGTRTLAIISGADHDFRWGPGPVQAKCKFGLQPAGSDCSCGIYAMKQPDFLKNAAYGLHVQVKGWGRCQIHSEGWKSEFAMISGLLKTSKLASDDLKLLSDRFEVPIL